MAGYVIGSPDDSAGMTTVGAAAMPVRPPMTAISPPGKSVAVWLCLAADDKRSAGIAVTNPCDEIPRANAIPSARSAGRLLD
jgi:hypothetical protein